MSAAAQVRIVLALARRALNEVLRVPGGALPGVVAPAIFLVGLSGVFGAVAHLRDFPPGTDFRSFIVPVGLLQGAGFTGAATGVNLARDIEQGWFDRLLLGPAPRTTLLAGVVASAAVRALLPATFLLAVALVLGVGITGPGALVLAYVLVIGVAMAAACWGTVVALRFRTQQAAPLMQNVTFASILLTTAYAPAVLLSDWLRTIANVNPVRYVLEGVRQAFVGGVSGPTTLHACVALAGLLGVLGAFAVRGMRRVGR